MQKVISIQYDLHLSPTFISTTDQKKHPTAIRQGERLDCVSSDAWYSTPDLIDAYTNILRSTEENPYSISNSEKKLLLASFEEIYARLSFKEDDAVCVIDLGSGNGKKTKLFVKQLLSKGHKTTVVPIDISDKNIQSTLDALSELDVSYLDNPDGIYISDFYNFPITLSEIKRQAPANKFIILFLGSTLGNFSAEDSDAFLYRLANDDTSVITGTSVLNMSPSMKDNLVSQYRSQEMIMWLHNISHKTVFELEKSTAWQDMPNGSWALGFNETNNAIEATFTFLETCQAKMKHDQQVYLFEKNSKLLFFKSQKYDMAYFHSAFEQLPLKQSSFFLQTRDMSAPVKKFNALTVYSTLEERAIRQDHLLFLTQSRVSIPRELPGIHILSVAVILLEQDNPFPEFSSQFQTLFSGPLRHYPIEFKSTIYRSSDLKSKEDYKKLKKQHSAVSISGGYGHPSVRSQGDLQLLFTQLNSIIKTVPVIGFCMGMQLSALATGHEVKTLFSEMKQYLMPHRAVDFNSLHLNPRSILNLYYCHQFGVKSVADELFLPHFSIQTPGGRSHFFQAHPESGESRLRTVFPTLTESVLETVLTSHRQIQYGIKESLAFDYLKQ